MMCNSEAYYPTVSAYTQIWEIWLQSMKPGAGVVKPVFIYVWSKNKTKIPVEHWHAGIWSRYKYPSKKHAQNDEIDPTEK